MALGDDINFFGRKIVELIDEIVDARVGGSIYTILNTPTVVSKVETRCIASPGKVTGETSIGIKVM